MDEPAPVNLPLLNSGEPPRDYFMSQILVPIPPPHTDSDQYDSQYDVESVRTFLFHDRILHLDNITHSLYTLHTALQMR